MRTGEQIDLPEAVFLTGIGEAIQQARKRSALTQDEVAAYLGLSRSSIANIEAGRQNLSAFTLARLAALLGVEAPGVKKGPAYVVDDEKRRRLGEENRRLRARINAMRKLANGWPCDAEEGDL